MPRYANVPAAVWSHADDAAFLSSGYGLAPDPWQYTVIDGWLGVGRNGRFAAGRCGLAVPRQNGKNGVVEMVELYKMVILGRKILHTAHEVKTARKAFIRLAGFFENARKWPELAAMVVDVRRTNGQEAVVLSNGASCEFVARSRGSGRGYTVDDLVLDEAQDLTDEQLEALLPTISSAPSGDPQLTMIGTPPGPNSPGEVFTRMRDAGVAGKDRRLAWFEWSPPPGKLDLDSPLVWAEMNPSLGIRLNRTVIEDERAQMSEDGFRRERLGAWTAEGDRRAPAVVPAGAWGRLVLDDPPVDGALAFGVKFSPDGEVVALSVGLRPDGGPIHLEGILNRPMADGTRGLVAFLQDRWSTASSIVVDGRAGALAFAKELRQAGIPERRIIQPTVDQVISAHSAFLSAVVGGAVSHIGDPAVGASLASAGRRKIGNLGGWGFESVDGGDVTLAESVVLAHYGASTAKRRRPDGQGRRRAMVS